MAVVFITRSVEFSAAHRLYLPEFSEMENFQWFGKCANKNGHGHNYTLEVTLAGEVDPKLGMVEHLHRLKGWLKEVVVEPLDHKNLNMDVPWLADKLPTLENVVMGLWEELKTQLPGQGHYKLHKLKLSSSARNWVEYFGNEPQSREESVWI